jgi:hypothetical protein
MILYTEPSCLFNEALLPGLRQPKTPLCSIGVDFIQHRSPYGHRNNDFTRFGLLTIGSCRVWPNIAALPAQLLRLPCNGRRGPYHSGAGRRTGLRRGCGHFRPSAVRPGGASCRFLQALLPAIPSYPFQMVTCRCVCHYRIIP